jgi:hypothetical protein
LELFLSVVVRILSVSAFISSPAWLLDTLSMDLGLSCLFKKFPLNKLLSLSDEGVGVEATDLVSAGFKTLEFFEFDRLGGFEFTSIGFF